jgi:hypothetical protein
MSIGHFAQCGSSNACEHQVRMQIAKICFRDSISLAASDTEQKKSAVCEWFSRFKNENAGGLPVAGGL